MQTHTVKFLKWLICMGIIGTVLTLGEPMYLSL